MIDGPTRSRALELIEAAGGSRESEIVPLPGGANNRVCRVNGAGRPLLLKIYFQSGEDTRDRLNREFDFLRVAWGSGIRSVARPLACDETAGLGLYEYIEGERFAAGEVHEADVEQAASFVVDLNGPEARARAASLQDASEACFSLDEHLARVDTRVARLDRIVAEDDIDAACERFVAERLKPVWSEVSAETRRRAAGNEDGLASPLADTEKIVSPSDFGFHNALRTESGVRFLDFEYAGWDDPAKLVCDFFCQVEVPVPIGHLEGIVSAATGGLAEPDPHAARARLLLPVYRVKWCCILLNDFLEPGRSRRRFSLGEAEASQRRAGQLAKAERLADQVQSSLA